MVYTIHISTLEDILRLAQEGLTDLPEMDKAILGLEISEILTRLDAFVKSKPTSYNLQIKSF